MARVIKQSPQDLQAKTGEYPRKALIYGTQAGLTKQMAGQLFKEKILVRTTQNENDIVAILKEFDPDLVFLEINARSEKPIEDIVADVFAWMRNLVRNINKILNSPTGLLWQRSQIILFKSEQALGPTDSLAEAIIDIDESLRKCMVLGQVQYIGAYSPVSFISKVRPWLEG